MTAPVNPSDSFPDAETLEKLGRRWSLQSGSAFYDRESRTDAYACLRVLAAARGAREALALHPVTEWNLAEPAVGCPTCRTVGPCPTRLALTRTVPAPANWSTAP